MHTQRESECAEESGSKKMYDNDHGDAAGAAVDYHYRGQSQAGTPV